MNGYDLYASDLSYLKGSVRLAKERRYGRWATRTSLWSVLLAAGIVTMILPTTLFS